MLMVESGPVATSTRFRKRRRVVLWFAVCLAVLAGGGWFGWQQHFTPSNAPREPRAAGRASVPVTIAVASRLDLPIYLTGLGTVQASYTVAIHSQVEGKLQEVNFTEGQHVKKGDVLAKIDPRLFQAALDQAKAKRAQNVALLAGAEKDLTRAKELREKNAGTQQNLDQQQTKVEQLKASIAADEAAIDTAQTQLDYTTIVAPNDGRIGVRQVDPGNLVRPTDTSSIATLVSVRPSAVMFTLPARVLGDVRSAMARGPVEVTAFDQDNLRALSTGTLLLIDNLISQSASTIRLKAMFANDDEVLWPGDFVNARLLLETRSNALVVPSSAVQRGPQGLTAWIVTEKNTAEMRKIAVGPTTGPLTIITSGLTDGDRVVTDGQYRLQANSPVITNKAASVAVGGTE
jgi:multidrug efflux system membrane fusion protein